MEMTTTKRTRNATNSLDKPADKSMKLDICVTCQNAVSDECIVCVGVSSGSTEPVLILSKVNLLC